MAPRPVAGTSARQCRIQLEGRQLSSALAFNCFGAGSTWWYALHWLMLSVGDWGGWCMCRVLLVAANAWFRGLVTQCFCAAAMLLAPRWWACKCQARYDSGQGIDRRRTPATLERLRCILVSDLALITM
jgi:hypothetical protein